MGLFSSSKKTDPAYKASQAQAAGLTDIMMNQKLPALPSFTAAQQAQMTPAVTVPTSLPSYLGGGAARAFPAGMPNQLSMIANQLSAGGYGSAPAISAQLSGIYKPMVVAPKPKAVAKPVVAAKKPVAAVKTSAAVSAPVAVKKPMGFTGASQPTPIPSTSSSLYGGPMFNLPSDFLRFLQNPTGYSNINKR